MLKVISSSPGELEPVFNAMLENATRICGAKFGTLFRCDDNVVHLAAQFGTPPALAEYQQKRGPFRPDATGTVYLAASFEQMAIVHRSDSAAIQDPGVATTLGGARSILGVPMFKEGCADRCNRHLSPGGAAVHRQADRAGAELRRAGGDRHREHAAAQRAARIRCSSRPRPLTCSR